MTDIPSERAIAKVETTACTLARYEGMCRAIAECHAVDEVKDIRDKAKALEVYARQAQNFEAERKAQEVRVRAERRAGELLTAMPKARGVRMNGRCADGVLRLSSESTAETRTLPELGISRDQSSQWQALANVPQATFERALADPSAPVSAARIVGQQRSLASSRGPIPKIDPQALWLWELLREIEKRGLFDLDLAATYGAMNIYMRADVQRLAPLVARRLLALAANPQV